MHDTNVEDRLRAVLRNEGDSLPLTVTAAELERRLAARRRSRLGQRWSLMAAGLAVVAAGAAFAFSNGLFDGPSIGTDPSPRPTVDPSASPSVEPLASPDPSPEPTARVAEPLGSAGQAILVRAVGADPTRPDSFEVIRIEPSSGAALVMATIPGSALPEDGWLDGPEGAPSVSATGWLAIPFTRGLNADVNHPALAIVDIRAHEQDPWILDGYRSLGWDITDKLTLLDGEVITIAWPGSRYLESFAARDSSIRVDAASVTTQVGSRFLASQGDDAVPGFVGFDGSFTATNDLPPVYQRTGIERPAGAGGHGLGMSCDGGVPGGCYLVETDPTHAPVRRWHDYDKSGNLFDHAWAVDGASVWLLVDGGQFGGVPTVDLFVARDPAHRTEVNTLQLVDDWSPRILGIAGESIAGSAAVIALGDADGYLYAFVLADGTVVEQDGTARFAGWAADQPDYDPD